MCFCAVLSVSLHELCEYVKQAQNTRLEKQIKDDSISELSGVRLVGYYGYHT